MKLLASMICLCASMLAACVGPDSTPDASPLVSADLASLGVGDKTLGTAFKAPPTGIGDGDGFAPQPFVNGDGHPSVMVVAHHTANLNIGALDLHTGPPATRPDVPTWHPRGSSHGPIPNASGWTRSLWYPPTSRCCTPICQERPIHLHVCDTKTSNHRSTRTHLPVPLHVEHECN